ncbi:MAG: hypothetical protein IJ689_06140 [Alphaproteobacteria bacterium]|nr:hypothetical protein [Alphaproteobacteria bacterium]
MNKYILMFGIAAVSIGSYCAYAGNSATMTVTATINHDVSLSVTQDINLGTITINPAYIGDEAYWIYTESGQVDDGVPAAAIVSADNATVGIFTANIPNPEACNNEYYSCGGLSVKGGDTITLNNIFGGSDGSNYCGFYIKYRGEGNSFVVYPRHCSIEDVSQTSPGSHSGTLTITYNAG